MEATGWHLHCEFQHPDFAEGCWLAGNTKSKKKKHPDVWRDFSLVTFHASPSPCGCGHGWPGWSFSLDKKTKQGMPWSAPQRARRLHSWWLGRCDQCHRTRSPCVKNEIGKREGNRRTGDLKEERNQLRQHHLRKQTCFIERDQQTAKGKLANHNSKLLSQLLTPVYPAETFPFWYARVDFNEDLRLNTKASGGFQPPGMLDVFRNHHRKFLLNLSFRRLIVQCLGNAWDM